MQYLRLHSKRYRYFQITTNTSSIGCLFFRLFSSSHAHFSPRDLSISFRSGLSGLLLSSCTHIAGFSAHFLPPTPSFPPQPSDKLPGCVFQLTFLPKNTRHVFFLLPFIPKTHFSPRHTPTSFCFVFSSLLFFLKTHDMCFFAYFSSRTHTFLSTISFLPTTYR